MVRVFQNCSSKKLNSASTIPRLQLQDVFYNLSAGKMHSTAGDLYSIYRKFPIGASLREFLHSHIFHLKLS